MKKNISRLNERWLGILDNKNCAISESLFVEKILSPKEVNFYGIYGVIFKRKPCLYTAKHAGVCRLTCDSSHARMFLKPQSAANADINPVPHPRSNNTRESPQSSSFPVRNSLRTWYKRRPIKLVPNNHHYIYRLLTFLRNFSLNFNH